MRHGKTELRREGTASLIVLRMRRLRALILDGHSAAALETLQSLGRRGVEVDVACEAPSCLAFHSRYVSARLKQPPPLPMASAVAWLETRFAAKAFDLLVPSTDASLAIIREMPED